MTAELDRLLTRYEAGGISREELIAALAALVQAAPPAAGAEPAVATVTSLNHVTVFVEDVQKSVDFYQRLFGMPVVTQGRGVNLRAGSGFLGLYPAQDRRRGIDHVCFGVQSFDADAILQKLADAGVTGRIYQRGDTKELYFKDVDDVRVQIQDARYRGGIGPLGDQDPPRDPPLSATRQR